MSAELSYGGGDNGMLRARATALGPWEEFYTTANPGGFVVSIGALGNDRWVSTEKSYTGGDNGMLRARATSIGPWEQYAW